MNYKVLLNNIKNKITTTTGNTSTDTGSQILEKLEIAIIKR